MAELDESGGQADALGDVVHGHLALLVLVGVEEAGYESREGEGGVGAKAEAGGGEEIEDGGGESADGHGVYRTGENAKEKKMGGWGSGGGGDFDYGRGFDGYYEADDEGVKGSGEVFIKVEPDKEPEE